MCSNDEQMVYKADKWLLNYDQDYLYSFSFISSISLLGYTVLLIMRDGNKTLRRRVLLEDTISEDIFFTDVSRRSESQSL